MKKPTFSELTHWLLPLFENLFQKNLFFYTSFWSEWRYLKKPVFSKLAFAVLLLFHFVADAQNLVAYMPRFDENSKKDVFMMGNFPSSPLDNSPINGKRNTGNFAAPPVNPAIKYAQLPYAGQVSICSSGGEKLPKLFLCGGNDSRLIETGITDAQSIVWEKFISGGSCTTVSNSDCANITAAPSCWVKIAEGKDYLANSAGQFRVKIIDSTGNLSVFYFNVYQNTLVPTAVAKNNIVKYGGSCKIDGKITVGGFGSGYEYSFTTTNASGTWQDSNVFTTSVPGIYTAFIRIKGAVGSCEFKVPNLEIKSVDFAVTTSILSPKCNGAKGSIQVVTNDVKQQYIYKVYNGTTLVSSFGPTADPDYTFTNLSSGTYKVETSVVGSACMVDTKTNIVVANAPNALAATAVIKTALSACNTGVIEVKAISGGTAPYKYWVNIDGAGFVPNLTNLITVAKSGSYVVRVEDLNGCTIDKTVVIPVEDKPVYTISKIDGNCTGAQGQITVNVTNFKGYTLEYSNNGGSYQASNVFPSLAPGIYNVKVRYKKAGVNSGNYCSDPALPITIGASTVLTASAGVAELPGCNPLKELQGRVRITNPQGGVPYPAPDLYRYSFDNKATWTTLNDVYINTGGPLTFYIQDAVGCEYAMSGITLNPKPAAPKIDIIDPVFNCDGSATSTVNVTNGGLYKFDYYLDGTLNPNTIDPNIFKNVTQGDHTVTVNYSVTSVPTYSNLLQENFGSGTPTTTSGISTAYCFNDQHVLSPWACGTRSVEDGQYSVASYFWRNDTAWYHFKDHTSNGTDPNGRYLLVNIGAVAGKYGILYSKPITDVIPNQPVTVDLYVANLLNIGAGGVPPIVRFELIDQFGTVVARQDTGEIAKDPNDPNRTKWVPISVSLDPKGNTNLTFVIRSGSEVTGGNDLIIDDIWVRQLPLVCNTTFSRDLTIDGSKAFSAAITGHEDVKCSGEKNGEITLSAQNFKLPYGFDYSMDNGVNWVNSKVSPVTVINLVDKIYSIKIRYDDQSGSCTFPFSQEVKAPAALKIAASVTKVATCTVGATITAIATFGTPGYKYELRQTVGTTTTVVVPFQTSGVFDNVPTGTYTVVAKDLNLCVSSASATVNVDAATKPTASFDPSNLCFDASAEIKVKVTGGVGPYSYTTTFNGGTASNPSATFDGPPPFPAVFTYNAPATGTYAFEVTDSYGCKAPTISQIINAKLTADTPVTTALDCDAAPANQAVITGTVSGGKAPFVVTLLSGTGPGTLVQPVGNATTFTYSTAVAATYKFQIKDGNNCLTTSEATINSLVAITLGTTNVNPKCNGSSDGSIQLNPGGGSGGFTYSKDGITYNNTSFFSGLSAGIAYTYYVKDSNKCTKSISVTLTAPALITGTAKITKNYTCDGPGEITVSTVSGGNAGGYSYTLYRGAVAVAGPQSGVGANVFINLSTPGSYTVTITDTKGCFFTTTPELTIDALNGPTDLEFTYKSFNCNDNTSAFNVGLPSGAGGVNPVTFQIIAAPASVPPGSPLFNPHPDGQYSGVPAGAYKFQITDKNNCKYTEVYNLIPEPPIVVTGKLINNVKCKGSATGSVEYAVSGFATTYSYSVNGGPTSGFVSTPKITLTNLSAGNYTITVTDKKTGCERTAMVTVSEPADLLAIGLIDKKTITCLATKSDVTINTTGGWGGNSYTVTGTAPVVAAVTQGSKDFTGLAAGNYTATVTDLNGCVVTKNFTIDPAVGITAAIGVSDFCYDSLDKATLVVTPNTFANYEYSINSGTPKGDGTFDNLTPGSYTIRVKDKVTGCFKDLAAQTIANPVSAKTKLNKDLDCDATNPNAIIEVTISDGYPNYTYKVNTTGAPFTGAVTNVGPGAKVFTYSAAAGTHYFEITDNKGCSTVISRTINAIVLPTFGTTKVDVKCKNASTGSITVNGIPATGTYDYRINGGAFQSSNIFNALSAGTYSIEIRDAKLCISLPVNVTIDEPLVGLQAKAVATPLTCNASNLQQAAKITVTATDGTPYALPDSYRYRFNGAAYGISNTFDVNSATTVTIDVKDANGCVLPLSDVKIDPLNPPTAITFRKIGIIDCNNLDADVELTVSDGTPQYKYEITAPAAATIAYPPVSGIMSNIYTYLNLTPRVYTFKVTDSNGCTVTDTYNLTASGKINVIGALVADASCNAATDGKIQFTVGGTYVGATGVLTNNLNATVVNVPAIPSGGNVLNFTVLPAARYTLTVTNPATGCDATTFVDVAQPTAVTITDTKATKVFCSKPISTITVTASGGTSPLYYAVVKQGVIPAAGDYQSSNVFTKDTSLITNGLDYDVYVKDKNGCPAIMGTVSVTNDPAPTVTASAVGQCLGTGTYTITATPGLTVVGTPTYSLNGGGFVSTNAFTITTAGDYTITIKDGNGCPATSNKVTVASKLTLSAIPDKDITCAFAAPFTSNDAQITLTAAGGNGSYTYTSTPATGTFVGNVFTTNTPGSYTFSITDANGCSVATTTGIPVTTKVDPEITSVTPDPLKKINCNGEATAAIDIVIDNTKGQSPFVFNVKQYTDATHTTLVKDFGTQTSGLSAGYYLITVTDAKGCTDAEPITITEPNKIVINAKADPITCGAGGISKGSVTIVGVTGGTGLYDYFITGKFYSNSALSQTGGTVVFNVVDPGLYHVIVKDANGCTAVSIPDFLVASDVKDLDISVTSPPANCITGGSATVAVGALSTNITGAGPFFFQIYTGTPQVHPAGIWKPEDGFGSKKATFTNLTPGVSYTFVIFDSLTGCYFTSPSTSSIPTNSTLNANVSTFNNVSCKGSANGTVSFDINSLYLATTDITYEIFDSITLTTTGITGIGNVPANGTLSITNVGPLPVGSYYVLIKESLGATNAGCSVATSSFSIAESLKLLSISASVSKNSNTCGGKGIITAIAKDGTGPYLYQIFPDNGVVGSIDGLGVDNNTTDPAFSVTFNAAQTTNTFPKVKGDYIVYAKDAYGCVKAAFVSLVDDLPPTITAPTPPCFVAGSTINLNLSLFSASTIGTPTYSINGTSFQPSSNFTISGPGSYTLAVKDGNGCIASALYVVRDEIVTGLSVTKQLDCKASPAANIHGDVVGGLGTGKYSYTVKIGSGAFGASVPIVATTFDYSATTSGTYTFVITDGTCSVTEIIKVDPKVPTVFTTAIVDVKCFGDNTGSISVDVTSGEGPFEYKLDGTDIDGIVARVYQTPNVFDLLKAGTYTVTVSSTTNLCEYATILPITVGQPGSALAVVPAITKLSCDPNNAAQKGTVKLDVTAGTGTGPNYLYSFNNSAYGTGNVFDVFDTGSDQMGIPYKVKDSNNCEVSGIVDILALNPPVFNLPTTFIQTAVTCLVGTSDVTVGSTKGIPAITYSIIAPASATGNVTGASSGKFEGLSPGDYTFLVTDSNSCTDQVSYRVNDVTKINLQVTSQSDVTCNASVTGAASFAVTGFGTGVGTYSCTVNGAAFPLVLPNSNTGATISLTGRAANTYLVRVTDDETGCFDEKTVTIKNPTLPLSRTIVVTPLGCTTKGAVKITGANGWGNYVYTLTPPVGPALTNTTGVFDNLSDITPAYTVTVTDANGCNTIPDNFTLTTPANPSVSSVVVSCPANNLSTLTVTAASGAAPYLFSIDKGVTFNPSNTLPFPDGIYTVNNLSPGSYDVVVKDAFGCTSAATKTVIEPQLFANAVRTKELDCSVSTNGTIRVTPTGGYSPYTYRVSIGGAAYVAIPVTDVAYTDYSVPAADSYVFEVTDSKGCVFEKKTPVVMTALTPVNLAPADIVTKVADCNGTQGTNNNGTITVNLNPLNNNPDYTYTLTPTLPALPLTQTSNVFTGLAPGNYDVKVTSGRGCPATLPVVIGSPIAVDATSFVSNFACSANVVKATDVVITGVGGTGTYSFSSDGTNYFTSNSAPADNKYTFSVVDTGLPQPFTYYVKDTNGCIHTLAPITIDPFPKLMSVVATNGPAMDCTIANNKQEMNVVITGGSNTPKAFTYQVYQHGIAFGALNTLAVGDNTFTYNAPTAGHYYAFEVIDNNTTCSLTSIAYDVPVFNTINVVATAAANVTCNGLSNGAIEINITGYSDTYDYEILKGGVSLIPPVKGSGDSSITSSLMLPKVLMAGTDYTVSVLETAFPSCPATSNVVVITEPAAALDISLVSNVNKNCNTTGAVVTVAGKFGTPGYSYVFLPSGSPVPNPVTDYVDSETKTLNTAKISPAFDSWDVYVKDASGCTDVTTIQITTDPIPTITSVVATQCPSSTGTYDITVTASAFSAFKEYSLDGNSFQSSNVLTVTSPGNYTVTVRDANQCTATASTPVTILDPLQLQFAITTTPTCNGNQGVVTLTASGGTVIPSYEYTKDNWGTSQNSPVFNGLVPNTYVFTVRDKGTTCTKSVTVVIDAPNTAIDFSLSKTDVVCSGESNGSVTVTMANPTVTLNNNPVYTYSISPQPLTAVLVGNIFKNLPTGIYTVTVTSGKGCPVVSPPITVDGPGPINVPAPVPVQYGCAIGNGVNYASITVNGVTGGRGAYLYEFIKDGVIVQSGPQKVYTETDFSGSTGTGYSVNVYDENRCMGSVVSPNIAPFTSLDNFTIAAKTITCISKEDITITVQTTGSAATSLEYAIVASVDNAIPYLPQINTVGKFIDLTVGSYVVTVRNLVTGCLLKKIHYVNEPNTFALIASNVKNVVCHGTATGSVDLTFVDNQKVPVDDAGAFTYTITGPVNSSGTTTAAGISIPNLPAGLYTVKASLVATPTCDVETTFTIEQPSTKLVISKWDTRITCVPGNDGTITVSADGGWSSKYQYELDGPVKVAYSSQTYFTDLTAGLYTLNVKDAGGCIETTTVDLKIPTPILATASATANMLSCNGDTSGEIKVDPPTGGQGSNYSYILNFVSTNPVVSSAPQTTPVFSGLVAGTYSVTVIDGLGCSSQPTADIIIAEPTKVVATLVMANGLTCKTAATLTLSATGGAGPYEYSTDKNFATVLGAFATSDTFIVGLGDHQYYVRDTKGCVSFISGNVTVNPLTPLSLDLDFAPVYCKGAKTGIIDAIAVGGLANYVYTLLDPAKNAIRPAQTVGYFDVLPAGNYIVRVDSGDCQFDSAIITISEPTSQLNAMATPTAVTCNGNNDGQIVINATGGTNAIKYAITVRLDQFFGTGVFNNLKPGDYTIITQDAKSCFVKEVVTITEPSAIDVVTLANSIVPEICAGDKNGEFKINITGGIPSYSVNLDNPNMATATQGTLGQTQFDFTNGITGGDHTVYIADSKGCPAEWKVALPPAINLDPKAVVDYDCVNNAPGNTVTVTVDPSNTVLSDIDYTIDGLTPFQASNVFANVVPGLHFVEARHTNGCIQKFSGIIVDKVDPLSISLDLGGLNEIVATISGGSGIYQLTLNGEAFSSQNKFIYYKSGDYTVTLTDSNGCVVSATKYFEFVDIEIPKVFTPNGSGTNDNWKPLKTENYPDIKFVVYDRYGRIVGEFGAGQFWDGNYNGTELPMGDYWYILKLRNTKDDREFVGHFTLYR